jgi:Mrp family chromosome partitioning ATPase
MARASAPRLFFPAENGETPQIAQFRMLRERLLEESSPRILLVTSPEPKEGKTTVAANLALCLAEFGRSNVLLVEANFQRPGLASVFDTQGAACFADQLMQRHRGAQGPFRPAKLPAETVHLLAVTSGPGTGVSVAWPAFQAVINEFRNLNWINHIVIDGPATLGSSDAKLVAQRSDRILLTAVAKQTRAKKLSEAAQTLEPKVIAGVVLLES